MFRIVFYLTLSLIAAVVAPGMAQEAAKEQQACLAKRPDQVGDLDGRIAACLAVIGNSVLPNDIRSEAYLRRASAYAEKAAQSNSKDHIDRAIADLSEGLRLDSDNIFAQKYVYLTRAGLYLQEGDYEQAIRDYTDFI